MLFRDFKLQSNLLKAIEEMGYETPTLIQAQTIPLLLEGNDVIGCAQTGTGKTAAFALPILDKLTPGEAGPQALIVTPTRELAEQIFQNVQSYSKYMDLSCTTVYGGVNIKPQLAALKKGLDILIATPGRLMDHMDNHGLRLHNTKFLVLDEADRMLDMGFLPDIRRILRQVPKERQSLLFSATMPTSIERLAHSMTQDAQLVMVAPRNTASESVEQMVYNVEPRDKIQLLLYLLIQREMTSTIVFTRTKIGADRVAREIERFGFTVASIHSNRSQYQRQEALEGFRDGRYEVLVATDIAARGLDVQGISHVINYDTPEYAEDYVHRIGRTGRAQETGDAWTFSSIDELTFLDRIEKLLGNPIPIGEYIYPDEIRSALSSRRRSGRRNNEKETEKRKEKTIKPAVVRTVKAKTPVPKKEVWQAPEDLSVAKAAAQLAQKKGKERDYSARSRASSLYDALPDSPEIPENRVSEQEEQQAQSDFKQQKRGRGQRNTRHGRGRNQQRPGRGRQSKWDESNVPVPPGQHSRRMPHAMPLYGDVVYLDEDDRVPLEVDLWGYGSHEDRIYLKNPERREAASRW